MRNVWRVVVEVSFRALFACAQNHMFLYALCHTVSGGTSFNMVWRTPCRADFGISKVAKFLSISIGVHFWISAQMCPCRRSRWGRSMVFCFVGWRAPVRRSKRRRFSFIHVRSRRELVSLMYKGAWAGGKRLALCKPPVLVGVAGRQARLLLEE